MFGSTIKPCIYNNTQTFINYDHESFQSILININDMKIDKLKIYLSGLLGLELS